MYSDFSLLEISSVLRTQKDGGRNSFPCPAACVAYNKYMGGVDRGDQLRGYYQYKMKSRKFYRYIANFYVGVSLTNAFIMYAGHPNSKMKIKEFQECVAKGLIGDYCSRRRAGRVSHQIQSLPLRHFPMQGRVRGRGVPVHCAGRGRRGATHSGFARSVLCGCVIPGLQRIVSCSGTESYPEP